MMLVGHGMGLVEKTWSWAQQEAVGAPHARTNALWWRQQEAVRAPHAQTNALLWLW